MKNRIWLLMMIAAIMLASCDNSGTPEPEPEVIVPHGAPYNHLGIGEQKGADCSEECGLTDYRTTAQKAIFPREINRYGHISHYTTKQLNDITKGIVDMYGSMAPTDRGYFISRLGANGKVCVTHAANGMWTWNGTVLGFDITADNEIFETLLLSDPIPPANPVPGLLTPKVAQLQPANGIRMANGKKSTEQFPAVASGDGKLPRAARAATGFELNRQAVMRRNGSCYHI